MTFGEALESMKMGKMIRRSFWDLTYLYINVRHIYIDDAPYECSGHRWRASDDDLLSNDWEVVG